MLGIFTFLCISLGAQSNCKNHLDILVKDKSTGQALPFASIVIKQSKQNGTTDAHGHFVLNNLCFGQLSVEIFHLACESEVFQLNFDHDLDTVLFLEHKSFDLDVVDIEHQHTSDNFDGHSNVLSDNELDSEFGSGLEGISKKIASLSFSSGGVGTKKPNINGLGGSRVAVIYNETALKYQQWGNEHASSVSLFAGDKLEVIDELGALKYGSDAFAGAVIIKDASLFDQKTPINLSVLSHTQSNALGSSINIKSTGHTHKLGELYYKVGVEYGQFSAAKAPDGYISNTANFKNNYFGQLGRIWGNNTVELIYLHSSSEQGIYSGSHIANTSDLSNLIENPSSRIKDNTRFEINRPKITETHEITQLKLTRSIPKGEISLDLARQVNLRKEFDLHGPRGNRDAPSTQLSLTNYNAASNVQWFAKNTLYLVGASVQIEENTFNYSRVIPDYNSNNVGAYAGIKHYFKTSLVSAGIRYEYQNTTPHISYQRFEKIDTATYQDYGLSAYTAYHLSIGKTKHQLQIGNSFRFPNAFELYAFGVHHGSAEFVSGNTALKKETALYASYRLNYSTKKYQLEINPYYRQYTNFINSTPSGNSVLTVSGAFPEFIVQNEDVDMFGINANVYYYANSKLDFRLLINRVWNRSRNTKSSIYGINPGSSSIITSYNLSKHFAIEYQLLYHYGAGGGQHYTLDNTDVEPSEAAFVQNINLSTTQFTEHGLSLKIGANNVTNNSYYLYNNNSRIFYPELGRNIYLSIQYKPKNKHNEQNKHNEHEKHL